MKKSYFFIFSNLAPIFLKTFYGYLHYSTLCFGAKIISQGIILTLKVKVPGLHGAMGWSHVCDCGIA